MSKGYITHLSKFFILNLFFTNFLRNIAPMKIITSNTTVNFPHPMGMRRRCVR